MDVGVIVGVLGVSDVLTEVCGQLHQSGTQGHWVYQFWVDRCVGVGGSGLGRVGWCGWMWEGVGVDVLGVRDVLTAVCGQLHQPGTQGHWVHLLYMDGFVCCCEWLLVWISVGVGGCEWLLVWISVSVGGCGSVLVWVGVGGCWWLLVWISVGGCGWVGCGSVWVGVGGCGCGWVWVWVVGCWCGSVWISVGVGGCGWVWVRVGGC